ncbi:MAG: hypothetical protein JNM10_00560 [Planctomycetia bacterium]|nr:hypothetical protein [Planctomycetia bacterium]
MTLRLIDPRTGAPLDAARRVTVVLRPTAASAGWNARWPTFQGTRADDSTITRCDDGVYVLANVPTGPCQCRVYVPGFLVLTRECAIAGPVDLGTLVLDAGRRLVGRAVADGTVATVPSTVVALPAGPGGVAQASPVGPDGRFELTGLTPGVYRLRRSVSLGGVADQHVAVEPVACVVTAEPGPDVMIRRWARPARLRLEMTAPADAVDVETADGVVVWRAVGTRGDEVEVDDLPPVPLRVRIRRGEAHWAKEVLPVAGGWLAVREAPAADGGR